MTDRPIIFSAPMILALLQGRKTMTRRLAWRETWKGPPAYRSSPWQKVMPGDRLWVREAFAIVGSNDPGLAVTRADYPACVPAHYENVPPATGIKWQPSIHMPRAVSRLTLPVTATKIEPLQAMTAADAQAEGVEYDTADPPFWYVPGILPHSITAVGVEEPGSVPHAVRSFAKLWNYLHGAGAWERNPDVVAPSFTVTKQNIDAMPAAAVA